MIVKPNSIAKDVWLCIESLFKDNKNPSTAQLEEEFRALVSQILRGLLEMYGTIVNCQTSYL